MRYLSNAGRRVVATLSPSDARRVIITVDETRRDSRCSGRSTHKLGAQIRGTEAGANVRLAHAAPFPLLALGPLLLGLAAALTTGRLGQARPTP